ncbi:hypothetical protein GUITHDRAFT_150026 [Guillardia theta CCMP2712]|uniref:CCD97-like C-terminal domain-containing protein n=1 Tax=Guillardia theta (strain CCMP2712) TaxID=905079 RepID=L1K288_GUITC|nr:hypothetical protein GUITHDRAFT_150026 [Guillardia theta CCMP2712]EKX54488.1 hypothetical protein GUITHDRAFT_150026 [Guillardia theta CCMP2712]|eukprot:XP_005841468.1 hypothetical protein GUITHDRAFT_150026 [Guillardia theta CCMP2712]
MGRDEEEDRRADCNDASEEAQRSARRRNEGDDKLNGPRSSATKSLPKSVSVRNRRLKKMNQLVEEGEYFSLGNMERRAPLLYHEHIGKFMEEGEGVSTIVPADKPSCILVDEDGRRVKEEVPHCLKPGDWRDSSWSGQALADFLLHSYDRKMNRTRREKEADAERNCEEEDSDEDLDLEQSSSKGDQGKQEIVSAEDRMRLRDEFYKIMRERFLEGHDVQYFDYASCDQDHDLDDLDQMSRDAEDEYFSDDEEPGGSRKRLSRSECMARLKRAFANGEHAVDDAGYDY